MPDLLAACSQMGVSLAFHIVFAVVGIAMPVMMVVAAVWFRFIGPFEPPRRLVSEASGTSLEAHSEREAAHRAFATSMSVAQIRPSLHRYDLAIGNVPYLVIQ